MIEIMLVIISIKNKIVTLPYKSYRASVNASDFLQLNRPLDIQSKLPETAIPS